MTRATQSERGSPSESMSWRHLASLALPGRQPVGQMLANYQGTTGSNRDEITGNLCNAP